VWSRQVNDLDAILESDALNDFGNCFHPLIAAMVFAAALPILTP